MKVPLPSILTPAIATIKWPLLPNSVPMYYESLLSLSQLRQQSNVPPSMSTLLQNVDKTIDDLVLNDDENNQRHYVMTSLALICLGNGLSDEAHDLITPLSWNEETYFGGPSQCSKACEEVVSLASYVHALVHRREGFAQGEFGMSGWQNANYWSSATNSRAAHTLPFAEVRREILTIGNEFGGDAMKWCQDHIINEGGNDELYWDPRALHQLCASTSRDEHSGNDRLRAFAERAAEVELKILLQCSLSRAGYDYNLFVRKDEGELITPELDYTVAQATANKVSSAHLGAFQSSDSVTIRNLVRDGADDSFFFSVAAGLACRLLSSPACVYQDISSAGATSTTIDGVTIILPKDEADLNNNMPEQNSAFYGGGPLSIGDAFANKINAQQSDVLHTTKKGIYTFIPCSATDTSVTFVDRFHGSRGETPTSVLQWSKGTIFETK